MGIDLIPMPFFVDGETYLEGKDCTPETFFQRMKAGAEISTSQPAPEEITSLWDTLLKTHDAVLHFPMSSGLSGSCHTAKALAQEYGGRVLVVENEADIAALPDCPDARRISRLAQTTLNCESVERLTEALRRRYPALECGPGICYATTNRQAAVRELAAHCGMVLIIGSRRSSNSNRLREIATSCGCRAFLIDGPEALPPEVAGWQGAIGVSAGASAPEELVERTVARLAELGFGPVRLLGTPEQKLEFAPPEIPEPGTV